MIEIGKVISSTPGTIHVMLNSIDEIHGYTAPACGLYLDNIEY